MNRDATVRTEDLARVLDYLEGLQEILRRLGDDGVGRTGTDPLVTALEGVHHYSEGWTPLRYQGGLGQGWQMVSTTVGELRERLLVAYSDAAL